MKDASSRGDTFRSPNLQVVRCALFWQPLTLHWPTRADLSSVFNGLDESNQVEMLLQAELPEFDCLSRKRVSLVHD